jgi:UDP-N-acetylglucosamine transferase subunit ALG13
VPIAVPRLSVYGEAVDDHQQAFCRMLTEVHGIILADTKAELHASIDTILNDPVAFRSAPELCDANRSDVVAQFARIVDTCHPKRRGRLLMRIGKKGSRG